MSPPLILSRRSPLPLHRQIYEQWRAAILAGRLGPGSKLPASRELAASLGVARATVTDAYEQLVAEGYLEPRHGAGTFVCRDLPDAALRARLPARVAAPRPAPASVRLSRYGARLEAPRATDRLPAAGEIDLAAYHPDLDQFPLAVWRRLVARQLGSKSALISRSTADTSGHPALRREVAAYLRRARGVRCEPEQVLVVSGSQQALDLCARVLIDPGDEVAVEEPCYAGARQLFAAHGARLRAVPVGPAGIDVSRVPARARLVYVSPSHQLPTGVSMSLATRLALLEWAGHRGAVIVEDDYDSDYRYTGAPLPALQGMSEAAPVVYLGTFSNVMFPALRIGYLVAPPPLVEPLTRAKWYADRHTPLLEQAALAAFMADGHFNRHVRRMRRLYGRRREALVSALREQFGDAVTVAGDAAGLFVMVRFASPAVAARADRHGVLMTPTSRYYMGAAPPHEYLLRFSALGERALRAGVRRLAGPRL